MRRGHSLMRRRRNGMMPLWHNDLLKRYRFKTGRFTTM